MLAEGESRQHCPGSPVQGYRSVVSELAAVDGHLAGFDEPVRSRLEEPRDLTRASAPTATESLKWGHPAYSLSTILFVLYTNRHYVNVVFTPNTRKSSQRRSSG